MNPKPDPQIAEPSAGYAEAVEQAAKAGVPLTAEQQGFLREAMVDFEELEEEAQEKGLPAPAPVAKAAALEFLHAAIREAPLPYALGMWDAGAVVICAQSSGQSRVDVFFDADGSASCHVSRPEEKGCKHHQYPSATAAANKQMFGILRKMRG